MLICQCWQISSAKKKKLILAEYCQKAEKSQPYLLNLGHNMMLSSSGIALPLPWLDPRHRCETCFRPRCGIEPPPTYSYSSLPDMSQYGTMFQKAEQPDAGGLGPGSPWSWDTKQFTINIIVMDVKLNYVNTCFFIKQIKYFHLITFNKHLLQSQGIWISGKKKQWRI